MLKLNLSKQAAKFLELAYPKHAKQIASKIQALRQNSVPNDSKKIGKYLRADSGEYRIIYFEEESILYIVLIGKRNDDEIYKMLKRL